MATCDHIIDPSGDAPTTPPATFLVSSCHLILASPVFNAMLTGKWAESAKTDGKFNLNAEDFDTNALVVVMNVLHLKNRNVPKSISMQMLAKIAIVVDYYQIWETLELASSPWITHLKTTLISIMSPTLTTEIHMIIFTCWVFQDSACFREANKVAILRSREDMHSPPELPIPSDIIG
ncbi:hypothetical protein B0H63DRAFT_533424 [Podospora didyma]|uniref:BTB domain-containing protein n=1 Tax=Podospora didyma TaxID=330526 RepID=A0AAE0P862_9PEZI|nr:hypothetical protein B0H63DRAFT_533424 [Podospora didyma]